jgi:hypothetical protein
LTAAVYSNETLITMKKHDDSLEVRCREMAVEAGMDPDCRIAKPGSDPTGFTQVWNV